MHKDLFITSTVEEKNTAAVKKNIISTVEEKNTAAVKKTLL